MIWYSFPSAVAYHFDTNIIFVYSRGLDHNNFDTEWVQHLVGRVGWEVDLRPCLQWLKWCCCYCCCCCCYCIWYCSSSSSSLKVSSPFHPVPVTEVGDCLATIDMGQKMGLCIQRTVLHMVAQWNQCYNGRHLDRPYFDSVLAYVLILFSGFCTIMTRWAPEVQNVFYQGNKRKLVPSSQNRRKLEHFFNCVSTLMSRQLQTLALDSASDFIDLLIPAPVMFAYCHSSSAAITLSKYLRFIDSSGFWFRCANK